jgi:hypothetical protein
MEGKGPLAKYFDYIAKIPISAKKPGRKPRATCSKKCFGIAAIRPKTPSRIEYMFTGDSS